MVQTWNANPSQSQAMLNLLNVVNTLDIHRMSRDHKRLEEQLKAVSELATNPTALVPLEQSLGALSDKVAVISQKLSDEAHALSTVEMKLNTMQNAYGGLESKFDTLLRGFGTRLNELEGTVAYQDTRLLAEILEIKELWTQNRESFSSLLDLVDTEEKRESLRGLVNTPQNEPEPPECPAAQSTNRREGLSK
jgi:chromosome segregation ATPase